MDKRTQALFERMADEWGGDSPLEILSWRAARAVVRAPAPGHGGRGLPGQRFTLEVVTAPSVSVPVRPMARHSMRPETRLGALDLAVVQRLGRTPAGRWYPDGPAVYVSPVPSAVLAVALR